MPPENGIRTREPRHLPIWLKIGYSAFVAALVPCYWATYGPWNFLFVCDVALLVTVAALWRESPLLVSMQAVAITLPQALWLLDLLVRLSAGTHLTGVTRYMFDSSIPAFVRGLSSFHGWLPGLLLWLVWRLRYDSRALAAQSAAGVALFAVCFLFGPPPGAPGHPRWAVNINYVYGLDDARPQALMAPGLWLGLLMAFNVVALYLPTHLLLRRCFGARRHV